MTEPRQRILFVCTGNACRSQMAEAWAGRLLGDRVEAFSAGTARTPWIHAPSYRRVRDQMRDLVQTLAAGKAI
ncbi:MAG: hypothetical protein KGI63_02310 [Xanthomonadaceae bacterium]|nr:hypothetical protein [Xanthomonadaceae bacterium]